MPDAFRSRLNPSVPAGAATCRLVALLLGGLLTVAVLAPLTGQLSRTAVLAGQVLDAANGSTIGFASVVVEDAASSKQLLAR
jgi:hypothetical protein